MSDPGPGAWQWGSSAGGPYEDVRGGRTNTNTPPGSGNDDLKVILASMTGALKEQTAVSQQLINVMASMAGKGPQGQTMGTSGHTAGRGGLPSPGAYFSPPSHAATRTMSAVPSSASVSGLRAHAARWISESDMFGTRLETAFNPAKGEMGYRRPGQQGFLEGDELTSALRSSARGSAVQGALGRAAAGGGLGGIGDVVGSMIPEVAAGPVGWAVAGATAVGAVGLDAAHMIASQRQQNAQYQSIMGGSNFQGFGQRIQSRMFGLSNVFGMGEGQAQQAFMGTTQMGMRGNERNNALSMAVNAFNSMGMSVAQSLAAINVQAQSGYENFGQLEQSLKAVSDAAKATSQNANDVRDSFISTLSALSTQNVGGGPGTTAAATAITQMKAGLGRQFAGVDFSGLTGQNQMFFQAAAAGQSINNYLASSMRSPNTLVNGINNMGSFFSNAIGNAYGTQNAIKTKLAQKNYASPTGELSEAQLADLTQEMLSGNNLPPTPQIQAALAQQGINISDPYQAALYYVSEMAKQSQGKGVLAQQNGPVQQINAAQATALAGAGPGQKNYQALGKAAKGSGITGSSRIDVGTISDTGKYGQLRRNYLAQVGQSGSNSKVIDSMLKDSASWSRQYVVQTADGQKTVGFQDLINNYADQAAQGGVSFASGSNQQGSLVNASVASVYGGPGDAAAFAASGKAPSASVGFKGQDQSSAAKKANTKAGDKPVKSMGTLQISATPQLQQLFGFAMNGQSLTATSSTSLTPPPSIVQPESMAGTAQTYSGS